VSTRSRQDRRDVLRLIAAGAAGITLPLAFGTAARAADKRVGLVVKNLGNSYFDACRDGALEAAKAIGGMEIIYTAPTKPTAEDQIAVLDSLLAQKVDGIIVAADDANALVPFGKKAAQRGIKVISFDSAIAPGGRLVHLAASSTDLIGAKQVQMIAKTLKNEGEVAMEEARICQDAARRDGLWRRPGRQELSRDAGAGEGAPQPQGRHLAHHHRY